VVEDQQAFFIKLREQVGALVRAKKSAREVHDSVTRIGGEIKSQPQIARYVGDGLAAQVEKVYQEMTGDTFPDSSKTANAARHLHRHAHALQSA
jgi:hypothetical protein